GYRTLCPGDDLQRHRLRRGLRRMVSQPYPGDQRRHGVLDIRRCLHHDAHRPAEGSAEIMNLRLVRDYAGEDCTLGRLTVGALTVKTLERPWVQYPPHPCGHPDTSC